MMKKIPLFRFKLTSIGSLLLVVGCITTGKKLPDDEMLKLSNNSNSMLQLEIPSYRDNTKGELELSINNKKYFGISFPTGVKPGDVYSIPVPEGHVVIRYYFKLYGGKGIIYCDTWETLQYELDIEKNQTLPLIFIMAGPPRDFTKNYGCGPYPLPLRIQYQPVSLWRKDIEKPF